MALRTITLYFSQFNFYHLLSADHFPHVFAQMHNVLDNISLTFL